MNEQEELLPTGRENPRWVIWENLGKGKFTERIVLDTKLGGHELQVGDVDNDGAIDIVSKPWGPRPWNGNGGRMPQEPPESTNGKAVNAQTTIRPSRSARFDHRQEHREALTTTRTATGLRLPWPG